MTPERIAEVRSILDARRVARGELLLIADELLEEVESLRDHLVKSLRNFEASESPFYAGMLLLKRAIDAD